ncbi:MAG TPA: hypothetical protein VGB79_11180 [Allosphingosinicella sp.]
MAKLISSVLTPAALVFAGHQLSNRLRENDQTIEQHKLIKVRRAEIWERISEEVDRSWALLGESHHGDRPFDYAKLLTSLNRSLTYVSTHDPYFSPNFCRSFWLYSLNANNVGLGMREMRRNPRDRALATSVSDSFGITHDALMDLMRAAREELSPLNNAPAHQERCSFPSDGLRNSNTHTDGQQENQGTPTTTGPPEHNRAS